MRRTLAVLLAALLAMPATAPVSAAPSELVVEGPRPATVLLPTAEAGRPRPLVVLLHGYTSSGAEMDAYLRWRAAAAARDVVLAFPDGTRQAETGPRFWNATDACCNLLGAPVDDVGYLTALVDSITALTPIDRSRVYLVGHSNGAFMSFRMACERADVFAAVIAIAGATYAKAADCAPTRPVSVLAVHGSADTVIAMAGGTIMAAYPSTARTLSTWAHYNACAVKAGLRKGAAIDIESVRKGKETLVSRYSCPKGVDVELWKVVGAGHTPVPNANFGKVGLAWLLKHRR